MKKRSALIIGCPGNGQDHLDGVASDMESARRFLASPRSGCFYRYEYDFIDNPSRSELAVIIENVISEYQIIFFAGHGYTDSQTGKRMICLRDTSVPDAFLINKSRIQLINIDACRSPMRGIAGIPEYGELYVGLDGFSARTMFDDYISKAKSGKLIIHSTQRNTEAWELTGGGGGVFTQSLIRVASTIKIIGEKYSHVQIDALLPHVKKDMERCGYPDQRPDIVFRTQTYNMPFIINAPQTPMNTKKVETGISRKPSPLATSTFDFLSLGILIIGVASLLED